MATITKQALITAPAEAVWSAIRDVGALHTRLCPGFVVDTRMEGDTRVVTFGNGLTARERIINVDNQARRLAYSATGGKLEHHSASSLILAEGADRCRFVWTADILPDALEPYVSGMMDEGMAVMKRTMEATVRDQVEANA